MQKHITNIHVTLTFPLHFLNQLPSTEFTSSNHLSWAAVCFFFCNNPVKGSAIANRDVLVSFVRFWRVVEWFVFQQLSIETCCTRLWAFCDPFQCLKLSIRKKLFDIKDCMEVTEHPFCIYLTTNECSRYQKYQEMGWNHSIYSIMSDIGAALQMPFFVRLLVQAAAGNLGNIIWGHEVLQKCCTLIVFLMDNKSEASLWTSSICQICTVVQPLESYPNSAQVKSTPCWPGISRRPRFVDTLFSLLRSTGAGNAPRLEHLAIKGRS